MRSGTTLLESGRYESGLARETANTSAGDGLAQAWLRLAVGALLIAGLFAVLVAIARLPVVQGMVGPKYFRTALVGHVAFSLNVWLLAFACVLWTALPGRLLGVRLSRRLGRVGLWSAMAGSGLMVSATVAGLGTPALVDYFPLLSHPVFIGGLLLFLAGVALTAVNYIAAVQRTGRRLPLEVRVLRIAAVVFLMALVTLWVAFHASLSADLEVMTWGAGHLLQIVNAAGLMTVWLLMNPGGLKMWERGMIAALTSLFLVPAIAVPLLHLPLRPMDPGIIGLVSWAGLVPATVATWVFVALNLIRRHSLSSVPVALPVSMALFAVGAGLAVFGLEGDTRVTAHYHGTVGAVTVAFMGLAYRFMPALGLGPARPKLERLQLLFYGGGLLGLIAGMYWGGALGATRKAFETFSPNSGFLGPTAFVLVGALAAVLGGALFVIGLGWDLVRVRWPVRPIGLEQPGPLMGVQREAN